MTDASEALERLTRWRDKEEGWWYYTGSDAFNEDVRALLSLLEWRPISEAPKDGTRMLFSDAQGNVGICWWEPENEGARKPAGWISDACIDFGGFERPSHFLPLPAAPTEDSNDR